MRPSLVLTMFLIFLSLADLSAAPLEPAGPASPPPLSAADAHRFAAELFQVVDQVARGYVRPVPRSQLLGAALAGLYAEAQVPVPDNLQAKLEEAMKATGPDADTEPLKDQDSAPAAPLTITPIIRAVLKERQSLGDRETLRGQAGLRLALQGMTNALDPYSKLVDGQEVRRSTGEDMGRGVGIELGSEEITGAVRIKTVLLGGPAQRAGIRPGDLITQIDGKPVDGVSANRMQFRQALEGDDNDGKVRKVDMTIYSPGKRTTRSVQLEPYVFKSETVLGVRRDTDESWMYLLDGEHKIGYIRLGSLDHGTADDLQLALNRLKTDDVQGLILDLRWSPGGFLNEAVLIARMFLDKGLIATIKSRSPDDDQVYRVQSESTLGAFPMIVLINGETSGGSELIAAALQDNKRAKIAGQRSLGKASVQTMLNRLPLDNAGFKFSTGNFIRPNGKALHRFPDSRLSDDWGVRPDIGLDWPLAPDVSKQLQDWWLLQSLRPSRNNEVLPLDDPDNDPQRQHALAALVKMVETRKR